MHNLKNNQLKILSATQKQLPSGERYLIYPQISNTFMHPPAPVSILFPLFPLFIPYDPQAARHSLHPFSFPSKSAYFSAYSPPISHIGKKTRAQIRFKPGDISG
jgi:hypothetical protein